MRRNFCVRDMVIAILTSLLLAGLAGWFTIGATVVRHDGAIEDLAVSVQKLTDAHAAFLREFDVKLTRVTTQLETLIGREG